LTTPAGPIGYEVWRGGCCLRGGSARERPDRDPRPGRADRRGAGSGYGGTVTLPTMQLVLGEITVAGNLIGTNPDLTDLIALAQQGKVVLHSTRYVSIPK
jgi:hypothetical protein